MTVITAGGAAVSGCTGEGDTVLPGGDATHVAGAAITRLARLWARGELLDRDAGRGGSGHPVRDAEVPDDPAVHVARVARAPPVGLDLFVEREVGRAVLKRLQHVGAALPLIWSVPSTFWYDTTMRRG